MTAPSEQPVSIPNLDPLFAQLAQSSFRQSFHLGKVERLYLQNKGMDVILDHAADFIGKRLAPANPPNDGKQTPYRNHPVFIAQHATGTCCRRCLEKWHTIPQGKELNEPEQSYIIAVIQRWLLGEIQS